MKLFLTWVNTGCRTVLRNKDGLVKLQYKLFICFLMTAFMAVVLLIVVIQISAAGNFSEFMAQTDLDRLDKIVTHLEAHYRDHKNWNALYQNPRAWRQVLDYFASENKDPGRFVPPVPPDFQPGIRDRHGFPPPFDPIGVHRRLCLFNQDKQIVVGPMRPPDRFAFRAINNSGRIVGYLGLKIMDHEEHPLGLAFLKKQTQTIYLMTAGILILTGLISFLLSRHLLSPIRLLTDWTKRIRQFDFKTRMDISSNDELGMLVRDFSRMAQTLQKYEKLRKNWISDISHELRTPVSVLKSKIEAVQDGIRQPTKEMIDSMQKDLSRLEQLIQDLHVLSVAESESLATDDRPVDVIKLLRQILETVHPRFQKQQISIEADIEQALDVKISGNQELIRRVFFNLITNSLRYTDSPGKLKISHEIEDDCLIVCFDDTPPGVSDIALEQIFDRLFRVDKSRSREFGGSGLGLSICRHIMKSHQGSIIASHSQLGGLMIRLTFPLTMKVKS